MRLFADYLDGELPAALCAKVEAHVRRCRTCDCVIDTLKKTIALYKNMPEVEVPAKTQHLLDRCLKMHSGEKDYRGNY